ncbi:Vacuolar DHA amino acid exporter [Rhodotorula toruloides ATCC 204091]|uniref:Vacuolar DHA amino acid exporter n=1 Tax=Rhodotorula toruloides TaxID=5286 RepID=A0A0K3CQI8_RHOTO|nr:Vacuolar DHA amino acid exporter [Rhodotorula toruloides ATCC 204091]PRQ72145.1 vacuolar DHA amino acid exporter [Rhodotorula toruloides]
MPSSPFCTSPSPPSASDEVSAPPTAAAGDVLALQNEAASLSEQHPRVNDPAGDEADLETTASTVCDEADDGERDGGLALDVEHVPVNDDPRQWPRARKTAVLATIAFTAMGGTISASVFFPALGSLQQELRANDPLVAASVSSFIAGQGVFPLLWSSLSEVTGRKKCYIVALVIYVVGSVVCSRSNSIGVFIAMRVLQSLGSSAVLSLGAGTLADMYDTHERGEKLGVYYSVPLLGPALGPIVGGAVTSASDWRAAFYFLVAYGGVCWLLALWLPDTFRHQRSLAWRKAYERAQQQAREKRAKARSVLPKPASTSAFSPLKKIGTALSAKSGDVKVKIRFRDINPMAAAGAVLREPANVLILTYSGLIFGSQYCMTYTASRTFAAAPYNCTPIQVGLVLLAFGIGNVVGSVGGGRYSDYVLRKMKERNGGKGEPEMRIKSTYPALAFLPPLFVAYAWTVYYKVHIAGPIVVLFFLGATLMIIYASTLAYIVDANPGRSSSAVACNSLFRGALACAASQAAEPIMARVGHGAFYSGWGVLLLLGEAALVIVAIKGKSWRAASQTRHEAEDERRRERREKRLHSLETQK